MKKRTVTLYIALFIIVMCLPHVLFALCKNHLDTSNYENRPLYEAPQIGVTPYKQFAASFDQFYNDRIPFRNQLIALNNRLNYYLFRSTTGNQVIIGKDGWLFLKDPLQGNPVANYTGEDKLNDEELKVIIDNLIKTRDELAKQDIEFVLMIVPNKSRVYSEFMPDFFGEPNAEYATKQVVDFLRENTDIRVVYSYEALMDEKGKLDGNVNLYHKADSHWNKAGAYVGAKSLLDEIGVEVPDLISTDITLKEIPNKDADLAGMIHMTNDFLDKEVDYEIVGYRQNNVELVSDDYNNIVEYASSSDNDIKLYLCRDSFATSMAEYIASSFSHTYLRHHDTYTCEDITRIKPDVFVYEVGERGVSYELTNFDVLR